MFRSDHFADVSLSQWMGVLPPELVKGRRRLVCFLTRCSADGLAIRRVQRPMGSLSRSVGSSRAELSHVDVEKLGRSLAPDLDRPGFGRRRA